MPVAPGHLDAFRALHDQSAERLRATPGFVATEMFEPVPGVQEDTVILVSFDTRAHLDAWLGSDDRNKLVELQAEHVLGPRAINVVGGFAGWLNPAPNDVVPWKSAVAVLLAIVPVSQIYLAMRLWLFPHLNAVAATFLGNVFTVIALTWVLMPRITRRLKRWLARPERPHATTRA